MTIEINTVSSTDSIQQTGYSITPIRTDFKDWNGGKAVANKPENRRDDVLLDRPTMEMGNETKIPYKEGYYSAPSQHHWINAKSFWERLDSHNRDNHWQDRVDVETAQSVDSDFKECLVGALASELGLNSLQKQRAFRRFMRLDLPRATGRSEINVFLICALVLNADTDYYGTESVYHPQRPPENNDEHFQKLENQLRERFGSVTKSSLTKIYNKLSQGNPPTRHPAEWEEFVTQNSFLE